MANDQRLRTFLLAEEECNKVERSGYHKLLADVVSPWNKLIVLRRAAVVLRAQNFGDTHILCVEF